MDIYIKIIKMRGKCPVYKVGDRFQLKEGYLLVSEKPLCMHSLASLMPHYNALRISKPSDWGLDGKDDKTKAYVQCLSAHAMTGKGSVIFEISKKEE